MEEMNNTYKESQETENKACALCEEDTEIIEYEDVKRMPLGAFIGIGLAFGVACGFSAGKFLFKSFPLGMGVFLVLGLIGGFIFGLINKNKRKPNS